VWRSSCTIPEEDVVLLCEQFRAATLEHGDAWLTELPAGMIEGGEDLEECARREALEETGYTVRDLRKIACVYLSPGGSSERIHIFYGQVSVQVTGGSYPVFDIYFYVNTGNVEDNNTGCLLQMNYTGAFAVGDGSYGFTGSRYCTAAASWNAQSGTPQTTVSLSGVWPSGTALNIYGTVSNQNPAGVEYQQDGWQSLGTWTVPRKT